MQASQGKRCARPRCGVAMLKEEPNSHANRARAGLEYVRRFLREYVLEWQRTDERTLVRLSKALQAVAATVNEADVVLLVKPGGFCPFCNKAVELMQKKQQEGPAFSLSVADLLHDEREALKLAFAAELMDRVITYPVVFVRGARVSGGFTELEERVNDGRFAAALADDRTEWTPPDQLELPVETKHRLLCPAGGGRWATFQWYVYGNVLRLYAAMQVAMLAVALALYGEHERVAAAVLGLLGVDMALFVVLGAAPWSPLASLATLLAWPRRGSVATALPYKFVFSLYCFYLLGSLPCAFVASDCPPLAKRGQLVTALVNSTVLAVFRF